MEIKTFKVERYKGCPIYIRQFADVFEYLTIINNQIYQAYIVFRLSLWRRLLGISYTEKELQKGAKYLLLMAQTTIDELTKK